MSEKFKPPIERKKLYWQEISELEDQLFPEFQNEKIINSPGGIWKFFSPSVHFRTQLIKRSDVENFIKDKELKMLSVGAGPAYLERLLVHLGIEKENIFLADNDPTYFPIGFNTKTFDMLGTWPKFKDNQKFDLIIIPENPVIDMLYEDDNERIQKYSKLFGKALGYLKSEGEVRMTGCLLDRKKAEKIEQEMNKSGYNVSVSLYAPAAIFTRKFLITIKQNLT